MQSLKEILERARREHWALPHFNISNLDMLRVIALAAREKKSPVLVGVSEGERAFIGLRQAVAAVGAYREEFEIPIYLNADHSGSVESAKAAFDAGFDSVHIDLSKKPFAENVSGTKAVVKYAHSKNPDVSIEGEIGYFVTDSSKVYASAIEVPEESLARPDEAARFVEETGIDRLAPVVGGIHGTAKNEGHLDIERIREIHKKLPAMVLVLHGGSGDPATEIQSAIKEGIANVHISTDLRVAYVEALRLELAKDEVVPYKVFAPALEAVKKIVVRNMDLFGSSGKI